MWPSLLCGCLKHWRGAVAAGLGGQTLRWPTRGMSCQEFRSVVAFCVFCPCAFVCLICLLSACLWIFVCEVVAVGLVLLVPQCFEVNLQSDGHFVAQEWPYA